MFPTMIWPKVSKYFLCGYTFDENQGKTLNHNTMKASLNEVKLRDFKDIGL